MACNIRFANEEEIKEIKISVVQLWNYTKTITLINTQLTLYT